MDNDHGITDELRSFIKDPLLGYASQEQHVEQLTAIADRIDAALTERYVELPVDAEGKYIHEHDKVDWRDHAGTWHENKTVVAVCNDGCYVVGGTVFHVHKSDIRHHYEPTVEDVLREFFSRYVTTKPKDEDDAIIAEYVAKLQLRGDAE